VVSELDSRLEGRGFKSHPRLNGNVVKAIVDPSGNQMVARGCLPSDVPNDLRTTDVSHQGCFDLKDDAVVSHIPDY